MTQTYSRPGYHPVHGDQPQVAKLQDDMIPAINRPSPEAKPTDPVKLDLSHRKLKVKPTSITPPDDVLEAAKRAAGPEVIVNPTPSEPPKVLSPGK